MPEVLFSGMLHEAAGGARSVCVEAATIRELLRRVVERYPLVQRFLDDGSIAVAVNGEIFRDDWDKVIAAGAEVILLPRIEGG